MKVLVWFANRTDETRDLMDGWNKIIQFDTEKSGRFYVETVGGKSFFHEGKHEKPHVTFKLTSEELLKIITGEIDADEAFLKRRYEIVGSIADAVKFRRMGEKVGESHKRAFSLLRLVSRIL